MKKIVNIFLAIMLICLNLYPSISHAATPDRLKGKILLQVQSAGEAWYVNPIDSERYYLGRPADAFDIMRSLGLGINNRDFDSYRGKAPVKLSGRILIKVQDFGKAYYVNPVDLKLHFLGRPADAFALMRSLGLGITNANLNLIIISKKSKPVTRAVDSVSLDLFAQNLVSPVGMAVPNDNSGKTYIVDQSGVIRVVDQSGNMLSEPFLDLRSKIVSLNPSYDERGLLGLAFDPDYKTNSRFYVYYSAPLRTNAPAGWDHTSRISEFTVSSSSPDKADINSERVILEIDEPQANHNAGQLAFGPDGDLYIAVGDGGGANDVGLGHATGGNAQDDNTLLGKILRIDVRSTTTPYVSPSDNPFVNAIGRDEIFAKGFRNPFHISFDAGSNHELIASDAGQNRWEEIDVVSKGGNYGWNIKEGRHCFDPNNPNSATSTCSRTTPTIDPVLEYKNIGQGSAGLGEAVVGGYVYRGNALKTLQGNYIFGDLSRSATTGDGSLFIANRTGNNWPFAELKISNMPNNRIGAYVLGLGQDANNELYVFTKENLGPTGTTGKIYKIVSAEKTTEQKVTIKNMAFTPQLITVNAGTKIVWENKDNVVHTVTSNGNFDSGNIPVGGKYELTLTKKGQYSYHCKIHPIMSGVIIVR